MLFSPPKMAGRITLTLTLILLYTIVVASKLSEFRWIHKRPTMIDAEKQQQGGTDTTQNQGWYTIEQVANRTGLTKRTLRYYEEVGLLPPTDRTEGNYRRYSQADVQRLERIKELRDLLDFSLSEIRIFLTVEEERGQLKQAYRQETGVEVK